MECHSAADSIVRALNKDIVSVVIYERENAEPMSAYADQVASPKPRRLLLAGMALMWFVALVPGVRYLLKFESKAGRQGLAPSAWHSTALPAGDAHSPTLLVALHPKCSCSDATLSELEEASQTFQSPYNSILLIDPPQGTTFDWQRISSYREAQKALQARVVLDPGGTIASSFGAFTSGDVLLYSAEDTHSRRSLLFAGGVTGARGMVGANRGLEALEIAFHHPENNLLATAPVFGCGLSNASSPEGDKQ